MNHMEGLIRGFSHLFELWGPTSAVWSQPQLVCDKITAELTPNFLSGSF